MGLVRRLTSILTTEGIRDAAGNCTHKSLHKSWLVSSVCPGMSTVEPRRAKPTCAVNCSLSLRSWLRSLAYNASINSSSRFRSAFRVRFVDRSRILFISSFPVGFESPSPNIFGIACVIPVRKSLYRA